MKAPATSKPRRKSKSKRKRETFEQEEKPAFVPRHIGLKFMAIKGVADVKPSRSNEREIEIILIPKEGGYNRELHDKIMMVEAGIRETLRSRRQKFYASISW